MNQIRYIHIHQNALVSHCALPTKPCFAGAIDEAEESRPRETSSHTLEPKQLSAWSSHEKQY